VGRSRRRAWDATAANHWTTNQKGIALGMVIHEKRITTKGVILSQGIRLVEVDS
jgi:hypothetical protein